MILVSIAFVFLFISQITSTVIDKNGYLMYCPCMGRFGNQADHFLGALAFAKNINRTLILPPWVEYRYGEPKSIQIPFDSYFKVEPLMEFHRVITMEKFMLSLAEEIWPAENRTSFCYMARHGHVNGSCNAKDGNPFGPFWDTFKIDFAKSEFYGPLNYDAHKNDMVLKWLKQYPPHDWPVLAFTGAPASFPIQDENRSLHKYLQWNEKISTQAKNFIKENMAGGSFIGIHLRNGADWVRACEHVKETPLLFSAPQCVGYRNEMGSVTQSMCLPSRQDIIKRIKRAIKNLKDVKYLFVASDANHMIKDLQESFGRLEIKVLKLPKSNPHLDLAILGQSNYFIGNCVSSFSAFVKRERDAVGYLSGFFAFPTEKSKKHEEL